MSRSGYHDDLDPLELGRWRAQVRSAIRGKRGQAFLRELLAVLDAMPDKRLIAHDLRKNGEVCTLGAIGAARGVNLEELDPEEHEKLADTFGIAHQLVQEIEFWNDEWDYSGETPERRWERMRKWVVEQLAAESEESKRGS